MVRLWRNNNGQGWVGNVRADHTYNAARTIVLDNARPIHFGLGQGTGDLIGGKSIMITPEMVGQRVLVFANVEVKTPRGRSTEQQKTFIHVVKSLGGLAGIARDEIEARKVLTLDPR